MFGLVVENFPESQKPVEIGDLGSQGDSKIWGSLGSKTAHRGRQGRFWASKGDLCQQGWGSSPQSWCGLSGSFALGIGLPDSLRSCPVLGRDFVNPFHPRAVEKCGCGRKGDGCMAPKSF